MATRVHNPLLNCIDLLLDAVFLIGADGCIRYVNAASERIFGYTPGELIGRRMIDLVLPEDRPMTLEEAARIMAGQPRVGFVNRYLHKDGHTVHIMWSARWSEADQLRIGVARDVTEQKHLEDLQAATYAVSEAAHDAVDLDTLFPTIHAIIARLVPVAGLVVATCERESEALHFPYGRDESGQPLAVDEQLAHRHCQDVIASRRGLQLPADALAPEAGAGFWLVVPLIDQTDPIGALMLKAHADTRYSDKDRELLGFVSAQVATAIERSRLKAELLRAARYDELTGLPNRRLFHDRIDTALARSRRKNGRVALLYLDIDDFKGVNDTLGHDAGDELLREFARRLERCVRKADTVARLGGDEFVVILEDVHGPDDATAVADKIHHSLQQPFDIAGHSLHARTSIGIALHPDDGDDADGLIRHADQRMYQYKARD
ncbi:diguanylate cyclase domain-containing protein [Zoogloea sp.]|uniref:diguanylate cyclase domain-containing protein n=1 Tax=Zoogloea sp. TaxID=49181 RepID=UPI00262AE17F|nr:diguanylate cyclase [uncultured Zoogloea sp.]MCK6387041.1 diguanylate cyclase [Zoogloea sp.]